MTPSWLNAAFIEEALRCGGEPEAVVTDVTVRPVGAAGDNYGSVMHRVTAETDTGSRSLIVKSALPFLMNSPPPFSEFMHETYMLTKVVPDLQKMLNEVAPGQFAMFSPKCFHSGNTPADFIVMEDLAPQGFRLANRHRGLGLRHSLIAVRTLARFHAASAKLLSQYPLVKEILSNPVRKLEQVYKPFLTYCFKKVSSVYGKLPSFDQECLRAIEALSDVAFDKYSKVNDYKPNRFNVINHGDFWCNNMLFRYKGDYVDEIRLIDYQLSRVTSPAIDLHYFFNTSVSEDVSMHHLDMLVREYHVALEETMNMLGMKAPSLNDLLEDMQEKGFHAVAIALTTLPIVKPETKDVFDVEAALKEDSQYNNFILPLTQRWLGRLLPTYFSKGWIS